MAALGKLVRTTAFKLSLAYLTVFALFAAFLLGYFTWNTRRVITAQITETVNAEITGLAEQYRQAGIRRVLVIVDNRSRRPGSSLYLVATPSGDGLAGNVNVSPSVLENTGWHVVAYRRLEEAGGGGEHLALARIFHLSGGFRLLVGRDLEERDRLYEIIAAAAQWSVALVIVLGLAGGFFITRRVLSRVDNMTATTRSIMAGDLSERLQVAGTGDELDRLADNLNAMLERIEWLMRGLKEVSDNIAHDLKTPLTRLRNRSEAVLRNRHSESEYRDVIAATIDESDALIATFNALLMIARAESGQARDTVVTFDLAEIARDVGDLYEPVAEDQGLVLKVDAPTAIPMAGHRELMSQALANLVDNAIKYAARSGQTHRPETAISEDGASGKTMPHAILPAPAPVAADSTGAAVAVAVPVRAAPEIVISAHAAGDQVLLGVADQGPGIPAADRVRVQERFVRLESSRSQPGSGLGLSLVAAVAGLHGGELRLGDNAPGLRAVLALPRTSPSLASPPLLSSPPPADPAGREQPA